MENKKIEILAPAGNMKSFIAACNAGANAIYMGVGKYNARVMAQNFTEEEYISAIDYAHLRGIKVYLTLNTLMFDDEIKEALELVLKLYSYGLDAVILQDIGMASLIHKMLPSLHLHVSTQMSVYSLEQVKYLQSLGFKRVVLARELTLNEIKYICDNVDIEIEVFVHGALCVSMSGQCLLSSTIGNRSANRGSCAQPCRMKYSLVNSKGKVIEENKYLMSKKDIYSLDSIDKIVTSGITSLKIEGRNKTPEYVALVVSKYRKYVDKYYLKEIIDVEDKDKNEIMQIFNRDGISHGYLNGVKYKDSITHMSPKNTGILLGTVLDQRGMYVKVKLERNIDMHDGVEIYSDKDVFSTIVTCIKDDRGNIINKEANVGEYVWLGDISKKIKYGSKIYKTSSYKLNSDISKKYVNTNIRRRKINLDVLVKENENIFVVAYDDNIKIEYKSDYIATSAKSRALQSEDIINAFSKTLDTAFEFNNINITLEDMLFVPVSILNEVRRDVIKSLEEKILVRNNTNKINIEEVLKLEEKCIDENKTKTINSLFIYEYNDNIDYLSKYSNIERIDILVKDFIKFEDNIFEKYKDRINIAIYIPNFVLKNLDKYIKENLERIVLKGIDTIILSSFSYMDIIEDIKKKKDIKVIADYSFNVSNKYSAIFIKNLGFDVITPAYDTPNNVISQISKYVKIELVHNYIQAMTSRFCILGSFVANRNDKKCSMPCNNDKYYLLDSYGYKYYIVCDNTDCIMRLIRSIKNIDAKENNIENVTCIRKVVLK